MLQCQWKLKALFGAHPIKANPSKGGDAKLRV
jgi:hypothetical protein